MKFNRYVIIASLMIVVIMAIMSGCKYDVAEPLWDKPYTSSAAPTISLITPSAATGGFNTITITGQNFASDSTHVYVSKMNGDKSVVEAEILSASSTSITIRRPNIYSDSCRISVVSPNALLVAKSDTARAIGPYKISQVSELYGGFLDNTLLSAITMDNAGNIYVVATNKNHPVIKVSPNGDRVSIGNVGAATNTSDIRISPDGKSLIIFGSALSKYLSLDLNGADTGAVQWYKKSTKAVKFGDFDANGILYSGGIKNGGDLIIMLPDSSFKSSGKYTSNDIIQGIRVFNGYVYVIDSSTASGYPLRAVYRNQILGNGDIGSSELVVDLSSQAPITGITFSSDGTYMYLGTNGTNGLLVVTMATQTIDILYKGIVPSYVLGITSSPGSNYLYLVCGNAAVQNNPYVAYQIDIGTPGAPNY